MNFKFEKTTKVPQYSKISFSMAMIDLKEIPAPPRLIPTLVAGFDAITNHIWVIIFPIAVDMLVWLAPHFRIKGMIETFIGEMVSLSSLEGAEFAEMINVGQQVWLEIAEQFNLAIVFRSYPVGIPSLMASSLPLDTPIGRPVMLEISSLSTVFFIGLILFVLGLVFGTLYYQIVAQVALTGNLAWLDVSEKFIWVCFQVILLALVWIVIFLFISIPASCILSLAGLAGFSLGQLGILLYGGFMVWLIFPLIFSAHGIFVKNLAVWPSIRMSIRLTNATLPTTVLFFLSAFILTQGLNMLWRIPMANSWLTLLGVAGHAFVVSGILAASFIYYRDADHWYSSLSKQIQITIKTSVEK